MDINNEKFKKNINLFACLFQAAVWQTSTFAYDFHFGTKYKIKKFLNLAYDMLDSINKEIKNDNEASQYFDEQTSFYLDVVNECYDITDKEKQQLFKEIIKSFKTDNFKIIREEQKQNA